MGRLDRIALLAQASREASESAEEARERLYRAIRAEVRRGESLRTLGRAAGLSHTRIAQIAKGE